MLNSKCRAAGVSLALSLCVGWLPASVADDAATTDDDSARETIVGIARGYKLFIGPDRRPLEMQPEPVLRWPNPTREVPDGATFIWTFEGRPEAIGCVWKHGILSHAFQSLSASKLVAQHGEQTVWQPARAGITFPDFPTAP